MLGAEVSVQLAYSVVGFAHAPNRQSVLLHAAADAAREAVPSAYKGFDPIVRMRGVHYNGEAHPVR